MIEEDDLLQKNVEYTFISLLSVMILPCIAMNFFVMLKILKKNKFNGCNIVPKTIGLYYNIALCDLLMGVLVLPWVIYYIEIGRPAPGPVQQWDVYNSQAGHRLFCVISGYSYNVLVRVTSLTVFLLSIDRTHAIYFPLTYSKPHYREVYKYCTAGIWVFALGTQALPFIAGIPYIEQPTREFICSWSITELLGLAQDEIYANKLQIFFPYFVLVNIPVVIPSTTSVFLSFGVLFKIFYKRYQYITERQNNTLNLNQDMMECTPMGKIKAVVTFNWGKENYKIRSLTRASFTMLIIVMTYTVCFAYYWFICIANSLYLLGVELTFISSRDEKAFIYLNNSYQFATFFHATISPFIVYYRVIRNYSGGKGSNNGPRSRPDPTFNLTVSGISRVTGLSRVSALLNSVFKKKKGKPTVTTKTNGHFKNGDISSEVISTRTCYNQRTCEIGKKPEYV